MRSSANFQVTSHRFNNSYVVKYNGGKEIRKAAFIEFKNNEGEIEILAREGADPNAKISGVQIWQKSDKNKDSLKNKSNLLEISRAEVSHNLLCCDYTHFNGYFTHISTMPPEYRPSPLKKITNQELE